MAVFLKLKLAGRGTDCLVNVEHIQQVKSLNADIVRIYWGTALPDGTASHDDYDISLDDLIERLRELQVEVLP